MSLVDMLRGQPPISEVDARAGDLVARLAETHAALAVSEAMRTMQDESAGVLALALEDRGWASLSRDIADGLGGDGRRSARTTLRLVAIANPLTRRALNLRTAYVWGGGCDVMVRDGRKFDAHGRRDAGTQDVNDVVQTFLEANQATWLGARSRKESEWAMGTDGEVLWALFTDPLDGTVLVRRLYPDEIEHTICKPGDRDTPRFYLRCYREDSETSSGVYSDVERRVAHPALGYFPLSRRRSIRWNGRDYEVMWDAPVEHVADNRTTGQLSGLGDGFSTLAWTRLYQEGLQDGALLIKALSRIAYTHSLANPGQAERAASAHLIAAQAAAESGMPVGGTMAMGPGQSLDALSKSGAFIRLDELKPIAAMIAAGWDIPLPMLLADPAPGDTGARAANESLDGPTELIMDMRRELWAYSIKRICGYVIDQAVLAPRGALTGTLERKGDAIVVTLPEGDDRTVDVSWPAYDDDDVKAEIEALSLAKSSGLIPPLFAAMRALHVLGAEDVDEWLDSLLDDQNQLIDPTVGAGQAAADRARAGLNPEDVPADPPAA